MKSATIARTAVADAFVDLFDVGSGVAVLEVRSGAAPANPQAADSGTLLASLPLSNPAFGAASSGVATANSITSDTNIDATGTAGHIRAKNRNGAVVADLSVGTSGADVNFNSLSFIAGGTCSITSMTLTAPES